METTPANTTQLVNATPRIFTFSRLRDGRDREDYEAYIYASGPSRATADFISEVIAAHLTDTCFDYLCGGEVIENEEGRILCIDIVHRALSVWFDTDTYNAASYYGNDGDFWPNAYVADITLLA